MDSVDRFQYFIDLVKCPIPENISTSYILKFVEFLKEATVRCLDQDDQRETEEDEEKRNHLSREDIPALFFQDIYQIVRNIQIYFAQHCKETADEYFKYDFYSNLFRFGRTVVVNCKRNQDLIVESRLIRIPVEFLNKNLIQLSNDQIPSSGEIESIRLALQMVYNTMTGNYTIIKRLVEESNWFELSMRIMASYEDEKVILYSAMNNATVLRIMEASNKLRELFLEREIVSTILKKLDTLSSPPEISPAHLWFSAFVSKEQLISVTYAQLSEETRLLVLDAVIKYELAEDLNSEVLQYFKEHLVETCNTIMTVNLENVEPLVSEELTKLIQLFCYLSGSKLGSDLQSDTTFVLAINNLLKTVHLAGKIDEESLMAPLEKLRAGPALQNIQKQPIYLFKSNLVRLVGSLAYRHKFNQDKVREMDVLSVILECTKIETQNPFIPQCSTFAIKCLLENNEENQDFVRSISKVDI